jgi:hypothetical protein
MSTWWGLRKKKSLMTEEDRLMVKRMQSAFMKQINTVLDMYKSYPSGLVGLKAQKKGAKLLDKLVPKKEEEE